MEINVLIFLEVLKKWIFILMLIDVITVDGDVSAALSKVDQHNLPFAPLLLCRGGSSRPPRHRRMGFLSLLSPLLAWLSRLFYARNLVFHPLQQRYAFRLYGISSLSIGIVHLLPLALAHFADPPCSLLTRLFEEVHVLIKGPAASFWEVEVRP